MVHAGSRLSLPVLVCSPQLVDVTQHLEVSTKCSRMLYFVTAEEFCRRFPASRFARRTGSGTGAQEDQHSGSLRSDGTGDDAEEEDDESDECYEWSLWSE
jgi:hypothetical protein